MTIKRLGFLIGFLFLIHGALSQSILQPAHKHFNKFDNVEGGWCAADGTLSIPLPGEKTLWLFGDTFVGEKEGEYGIDNDHSTFINNTAIIEEGDVLTTYHRGTTESPSAFIPKQGEDWFWPKHAVLEEDTLRIFTLKISKKDDGNPGFNFEIGEAHISSYLYPEMEHVRTKEIDQVTDTAMRFGTQVLQKDGYTYIFGKKSMEDGDLQWKIPYLARAENSVAGALEFYAGSGDWSPHCDSAAPIGDRPVEETYYVYEKDGAFYMLMHETFLQKELVVLKADELTGPYNSQNNGGEENTFAVIKEAENYNTYNLFAHPQFNENDKLLISFNVNAHDFGSIYEDTRNYRPRFYWLDVEKSATTPNPDTLRIFQDFSETSAGGNIDRSGKNYFDIFENRVQLKNLEHPAVLNVYGLNGETYITKDVKNHEMINFSHFPQQMFILKLVTDEQVIMAKMMNM